jgi:ABC-type spermidine/putrescine transport system permease subunit II
LMDAIAKDSATLRSAWDRSFRIVAIGYLIAVFVYLVTPIIVAAATSFNPQQFIVFPPSGFSLRWYRNYIHDPMWRGAIANTLVIGTMCSVFATIVGTAAAYGISRIENAVMRDLTFVVFLIPLVVPYMTLAMALYPVYAKFGLVGTRVGVALAQGVVAIPYVVLSVTAATRRKDLVLESAARTLGASSLKAYRYVVLPLIWPGMAAGAVLAFMTSFDDVVMPLFLGGLNAGTVPKAMLDSLYNVDDPSVMAVSASISAASLLLLVLALAFERRRAR